MYMSIEEDCYKDPRKSSHSQSINIMNKVLLKIINYLAVFDVVINLEESFSIF